MLMELIPQIEFHYTLVFNLKNFSELVNPN